MEGSIHHPIQREEPCPPPQDKDHVGDGRKPKDWARLAFWASVIGNGILIIENAVNIVRHW